MSKGWVVLGVENEGFNIVLNKSVQITILAS